MRNEFQVTFYYLNMEKFSAIHLKLLLKAIINLS